MRIRVKLFASLRSYGPGQFSGAAFELDLPEGARLADLIAALKMPAEEVKVMFINGLIREEDQRINENDEVGIFPPVGGGSVVDTITIDVWLYGSLGRYLKPDATTHANARIQLPSGSTITDLLAYLKMPTEERGITFINGDLSAMPGMQPDLEHVLSNNDRVAFFHLRSMWPFQYRHGVAMVEEMSTAINQSEDGGLHHAYD